MRHRRQGGYVRRSWPILHFLSTTGRKCICRIICSLFLVSLSVWLAFESCWRINCICRGCFFWHLINICNHLLHGTHGSDLRNLDDHWTVDQQSSASPAQALRLLNLTSGMVGPNQAAGGFGTSTNVTSLRFASKSFTRFLLLVAGCS